MAGIYIHVPFCKQACNYCNFHFSTNLASQNDFTGALLKEIDLRASYLQNETVETIYFGGGTPSLLPVADITAILESINIHFRISADMEISLECNPDDMHSEWLVACRGAGINRLSIGVQSFFTEDLKWMNRNHDADEAVAAVENAKKAGFTNFSLDLIYGFPILNSEKWESNLQRAIALDPAHLSCYALTVEPRTALHKMIQLKKTADVQPGQQATQFLRGIEMLESAGYEHYEISSFAKPGKRSRHNSSYWQSKKYLGLGPSAHSFNGSGRQWNIANNALYIQSLRAGKLNYESENLLPRDRLNEYIMTSLRTSEGMDLDFISQHFGEEKSKWLETHANEYLLSDKMIKTQRKLLLTREGKLFADGIASDLFFD